LAEKRTPPRLDLQSIERVPKRYRCIRCRSRIDPDLASCPFCGERDPLRYRRTRRVVGLTLVVVLLAAMSAWVVF
jgi:hypothetical protein